MAAIEWWHRIEVSPGVFTPGKVDPRPWLEEIALPADLTGKSILDIGCSDGFFAFECEKRGASLVVAADLFPYEGSGFQEASRLLGSKVVYEQCSVYDLSRAYVKPFDLVLFLGVFYHLLHPMQALEAIYPVVGDLLIVESEVLSGGDSVPLMRFFPGAELNDDPTNWWVPNLACLRAMLEAAGFKSVQMVSNVGTRAAFHCRR